MTHGLTGLGTRVHTTVADLDASTWDQVVSAESGSLPFLRHGFLSALEDSRSVGAATGWNPRYVIARAGTDQRVVGIATAFMKTHSMGEFVYDWAWADAAQRAGLRYYPKLVVAAPFSPVTGRRLLTAPGLDTNARQAVRRALVAAVVELAKTTRCSGIHVLFPLEEELALFSELGFCHRLGAQFHWENPGYADFEAFIARFDSKRRNQIRRERRRVREAGVEIRSYFGDEVEDRFMRPAFDFYGATVDRYVWGRRYLNERFFELLWQRMRPFVHLTLAWRGDTIVGGALDMQEGERRWGRYWGALAEVDCLHFEVCAYAPIDDCIRHGITRFEAGAGGEHKLGRGFVPTPTHSMHLLFDGRFQQTIEDFCAREASFVRERIEVAAADVFVR